jgi:poly(3-hydroxybutyrate) depolymerase
MAGGGSSGGSGSMTSPGCGQTPTLKDGTQSIQSGGQSRSYMIRLPKNYDNKHPYWLMFGYHWVGGTANDVDSGGTSGYTWSYYGLREQADNSTNFKAIFVAPQGIGNGWGNGNNSDVIFTDDMLKKVEGDLCVDTKHVFAMGFSYGGGMTKALGCQRPTVFKAIGVFSGADFLSGGCDDTSTAPIPFWGSHSITDGTNQYSSGITILNRFAKNDGCTAQTPPQPTGNTHVCTNFQGCKAGYPVEWCAFNGGGHTPAPVDNNTNGSGGGDKTWTKGELWKFFTQF